MGGAEIPEPLCEDSQTESKIAIPDINGSLTMLQLNARLSTQLHPGDTTDDPHCLMLSLDCSPRICLP
jgi:hypothetical protein